VDLNDLALSPKDAARFLGLSVKTLANLRCSGGGPRFQKNGGLRGAVRYPLSELMCWREARLYGSTSELGERP